MMKLIADSGSTKTDWCVVDDGRVAARVSGQGINPLQQECGLIEHIMANELAGRLSDVEKIGSVEFYGAGCRDGMVTVMEDVLRKVFVNAESIKVGSDMLGAARALFGDGDGIACILGTGANSCLYDGGAIVANVPPLGYILGDEGSGAVLGKLFVNAMFKGGLPEALKKDFLSETGLTLSGIIYKVYKEPMANRFLAGISPFIHKHLDDEKVNALVVGNLKDFFRRNVNLYGRPGAAVGAVGSIAYYYERQLSEAAAAEGYSLCKVLKSPMEGLLEYEMNIADRAKRM